MIHLTIIYGFLIDETPMFTPRKAFGAISCSRFFMLIIEHEPSYSNDLYHLFFLFFLRGTDFKHNQFADNNFTVGVFTFSPSSVLAWC